MNQEADSQQTPTLPLILDFRASKNEKSVSALNKPPSPQYSVIAARYCYTIYFLKILLRKLK